MKLAAGKVVYIGSKRYKGEIPDAVAKLAGLMTAEPTKERGKASAGKSSGNSGE